MLHNRHAKARRARLTNLANQLVRDALRDGQHTADGRPDVTPTDLAAFVFGALQIHLADDEATSYLNAALARRGYHSRNN